MRQLRFDLDTFGEHVEPERLAEINALGSDVAD
jgi:hypothetical protein